MTLPRMNDLHFAQPQFLWALAALPFLAALIFHAEKMRRSALDRLIAARLQPRLAGSVSTARRRAGFGLLLLGMALALVALARPQWGFTWEEKRQSGRDIIIAIDVSNSMLATDLQPNRLTRAKLAAEDLLSQIEGDRVGLLAFAGSSFLQAPLTSDFSAVRETLQELDTDIIPRGGTNLSDAIKAADEAFGKGESEHRALIIFSDGEELEADAVTAARACRDRFHTFTIGLGSADGSLIPVPTRGGGTEFLRDDQGQYVKSKLDEPRMREVAEAGGGFYIHLQNGPAEMKQIVTDGLGKMKEHETDARFTRQPVERYQWPLGAAMAAIVTALLIGERRRAALKIAAAALALFTARADARHAGIEKYEAKDYKGSLGEFDGDLKKRDVAELHFNAGSAAYELGDYARAADSFSRALGTATPELKTRAAYNLANTLARRGVKHEKKEEKLGDLRDSVQQYDEVLKSESKHEDAKHNRDIVAKLIADLEKEEQQEKKDQEDQKKDDKKDDNKDEQKKDQQDKQDSSQGGKDKEDKKDEQQKKDGSGKDEKSEQGKKDEKEQQSKDGKEGEKKDSQDKKDGQQSQPKDGKEDPGAQKKDGQQQKPDDKEGDKPQTQPKDGKDEKEKSGEVKAANPGQQEPGKEDPAAEAAEAAQAAQEGRMTEKDAAQILEALKRVDRRVRLLDPKDEPQKNPARPFKNW